jgi:hypothetical protein
MADLLTIGYSPAAETAPTVALSRNGAAHGT